MAWMAAGPVEVLLSVCGFAVEVGLDFTVQKW